jgi:hypothetical protein
MPTLPTRKRIFDLAGEANYQEALFRARAGDPVVLIPEPGNRFDANAIYVTTQAGHKLGYLARADAATLRDSLTREHVSIIHQLTGGMKDYPSIGCRISIAWDGAGPHPHAPLKAEQIADGLFEPKPFQSPSRSGLISRLFSAMSRGRK